jgi:hydrogenase/urease accessory protein HupE
MLVQRLAIVGLLCVTGGSAGAHEARPLAITITEVQPGMYRAQLHVPSSVTPDNRPQLQWPADCKALAAQLVQCATPLAGRPLAVNWPLYNPSVTTLLRFTPQGGSTRSVVMPPDVATWRVPTEPTAHTVMKSYFELGIVHILGGLDHLLFVLGLLLIARDARRLVLAVSGFTLAHSLTLSLAALGVVHVPVAPTEAAIALSILFLAREALATQRESLVHRFPLLVSALFGLLHGLGFAAALGEVGLPEREIVWALLFFNLGVEVGQLAFILAVVAVMALVLRLAKRRAKSLSQAQRIVMPFAAYGIGIPAAFWLLQRLPLHVQ